MSIHFSGGVKIASATFTGNFVDSENFVQFVKNTLVSATWTRKKILAGISFIALAITDGDQFVLDGNIFTAYTGSPHGPNPFVVGPDLPTNLNSFGTEVNAILNWTFTTNGVNTITFTVNDDNNDEHDGNLKFCSVTPTGSVGQWDFNPNATPGQGITWGGGFTLTSKFVNSSPIVLTAVTNKSSRISFWVGVLKNSFEWAGCLQANQWQIICNQYQIFLYVPMSTIAGTLFFVSHLFPAPGLDHCNYANGPTNPIIPVGGDRSSLVSIGNNYYVNAGFEYFTNPSSAEVSQPVFSFPGLGSGITPSDKIGNNRIGGKDLLNDTNFALPYETALVASQKDPSGPNPNFSILGYIWDAGIFSGYDLTDSPANLSGRSSIVLLSQIGSGTVSRGSLVLSLS